MIAHGLDIASHAIISSFLNLGTDFTLFADHILFGSDIITRIDIIPKQLLLLFSRDGSELLLG